MYQAWGERDPGLPVELELFLEGEHKALTNKRTWRGQDPLLDENRQLKKLGGNRH
ncbi:hypothetical protein ACFLTG_01295 [Chloroflexota bacterium]